MELFGGFKKLGEIGNLLGQGKFQEALGSGMSNFTGNLGTRELEKVLIPDEQKRNELIGGITGATAAIAGAPVIAAEGGGALSSVGNALGFTGEGGSLMGGLSNVQALRGMAGMGGDQGGDMPALPDSGYAPQGGGGFDLTGYLPQYYNGGIPNDGKPAVIYDMRTNKPTGTMNERGPETIVPAYADGMGNDMSVVNGMPPESTQNITVNPGENMATTSSIKNLYQYNVDPKVMGEQEGEDFLSEYKSVTSGQKGTPTSHPDKSVKKIEKQTTTTSSGKTEEKENPFGMDDFGNLVKNAARMYGYYVDTKRNNWGLGKSAITRYLDWTDDMDAAKSKKKKPELSYEEKLKLQQEYDLGTAEGKAKIKSKYGSKEGKMTEKDYYQLEVKTREEALEDWENPNNAEYDKYVKEAGGDEVKAKQNYVQDRVKGALKGEQPEYQKEDIKGKKYFGLFGPEVKKGEKQVRTGEYVPTDNAQSFDESGYIAWLQKQPKGKYKSKEEARKAYQQLKG